ncbi:MAG: class I SAM-dependent methyltransferase [Desulfovibrio sp.]|jgi:cephalosporin hydroxylase|nr:class I SAM-dependent methyltransferase [Desulfovibrio sp.]
MQNWISLNDCLESVSLEYSDVETPRPALNGESEFHPRRTGGRRGFALPAAGQFHFEIARDKAISDDLDKIRKISLQFGWQSWTSTDYQDAVIEIIYRLQSHPGCVIELGSFNGGMSVLLAYACHKTNKKLFCIDIDANAIKTIREHLNLLDIPTSHVTLCTGTIDSFIENHQMAVPPSVVIIDAMHSYQCCRHDLSAVLANFSNTEMIVLHDYALTYSPNAILSGEKVPLFPGVKSAVSHILGNDAPMVRLGITGEDQVSVNDTENFQSKSLIWEHGEPEAIAFKPSMMPTESIHRATSFMIFELMKKEQRIRHMRDNDIQKYTLLSSNGQWRDYEIKYKKAIDARMLCYKIQTINQGTDVNMRMALLAPDENNVLEQYFSVPHGWTSIHINASDLSVLRGQPDVSRVTHCYIGGMIGPEGIRILCETNP